MGLHGVAILLGLSAGLGEFLWLVRRYFDFWSISCWLKWLSIPCLILAVQFPHQKRRSHLAFLFYFKIILVWLDGVLIPACALANSSAGIDRIPFKVASAEESETPDDADEEEEEDGSDNKERQETSASANSNLTKEY